MSDAKPVWTNRDYFVQSNVALANGAVLFVGKAASGEAQLIALGAADGALRWKAEPSRVLGGDASVAVVGDTVYLGDDATVEAFGLADGKRRWLGRAVEAGKSDRLFPAPPLVGAGQLFYPGNFTTRVVALGASDGHVAWRSPSDGDHPAALALHGGVVVSYGNDTVVANGAGDGAARWHVKLAAPLDDKLGPLCDSLRALPDLGDLVLYVDGTGLVAVDAGSGKERWRYAAAGPISVAGIASMLLVADGKKTVGIEPRSGAVRWRHALQGRAVAALDAHAGLVIANGRAAALAYSDGTVLASAPAPTGDGVRVLASRDGRVVFADPQHALTASLDKGKLTLAGVDDHPSAATLLLHRRFAEREAQAAAIDGALVLVRHKSGTLNMFR